MTATYTKRLDDGRYEFGDVIKWPGGPDQLIRRGIAATYADAQIRQQCNSYSSFFRHHSCSRCKDGERACVRGGHHSCEWPHAKND